MNEIYCDLISFKKYKIKLNHHAFHNMNEYTNGMYVTAQLPFRTEYIGSISGSRKLFR